MNVGGNNAALVVREKKRPGLEGDRASARLRRHSMRILPALVQIGFSACCGAAEGRIIHGNRSGATVGRIIDGHLCHEPETTVDEEPTQQGRDGFFPSARIIGRPPMADTVVAVTIFQQYFPSMLAM